MSWNIQVVITLGDIIHKTQRDVFVLFQCNYVKIILTIFPSAAELVFRRVRLSDNLWEEDATLLKFCKITLAAPANEETAFCMISTVLFLFIFSSHSVRNEVNSLLTPLGELNFPFKILLVSPGLKELVNISYRTRFLSKHYSALGRLRTWNCCKIVSIAYKNFF